MLLLLLLLLLLLPPPLAAAASQDADEPAHAAPAILLLLVKAPATMAFETAIRRASQSARAHFADALQGTGLFGGRHRSLVECCAR